MASLEGWNFTTKLRPRSTPLYSEPVRFALLSQRTHAGEGLSNQNLKHKKARSEES